MSDSSKRHTVNSPVIDGHSNDKDVADIFSSKLEHLLNSGYSPDTRSDLLSLLDSSLSASDLTSIQISPSVVSESLNRLKLSKSDGTKLSSNQFICASPVLPELLSNLFTAMLLHGYVPDSLRDCILQPILKPGKDPSTSDNYRPIALTPTLSKVFELCLLTQFRPMFTTSSLQFGFKQEFSCDLCTGLIKNVVSHYCYNDSSVYGCFLDASKAFDRVDHLLLFNKLLRRNLPPAVVRVLLAWYTDQKAGVRWNGSLSNKFSISNGVRQGGVLSPILFTIYIDDLLLELEQQGIGCYWNHMFAGAVCYADDIALIAPSPSALRHMLKTCSLFTSKHSLTFNASKTQLIKFSRCPPLKDELASFSFCGHILKYCNSVTHLGQTLSQNLSDNLDITAVRKDMCRKANHMLTVFGACDPAVKSKLMHSYCLSLYGCSLWKVSSTEMCAMEVAFNNIVRKIWSLPRRCHTAILHCIAGVTSLYNTVISRSQKLVALAEKSGSRLLIEVFQEAKTLVYTSSVYNSLYKNVHWKTYDDCAILCASFIRDAKLNYDLNCALDNEINFMCTV